MKKKIELTKGKLIEYKGELYTPEDLACELEISGEIEVILRDAEETWFGRAMQSLEDK